MKLILLSLCLSVFANAQVLGSILVKVEVENSQSVYFLEDIETYTYDQQSSSGQVTTTTTGVGMLEGMQDVTVENLAKDGPISDEEFSKIRLTKRGKKIFATIDSVSILETEGESYKIPYKLSNAVNVKRGSWSEFEEGRNLFLEYTNEAEERMIEAIIAKIQIGLGPMKKKLAQAGLGLSEIQIIGMSFDSNTQIKANLEEVVVKKSDTKINLKIDITL